MKKKTKNELRELTDVFSNIENELNKENKQSLSVLGLDVKKTLHDTCKYGIEHIKVHDVAKVCSGKKSENKKGRDKHKKSSIDSFITSDLSDKVQEDRKVSTLNKAKRKLKKMVEEYVEFPSQTKDKPLQKVGPIQKNAPSKKTMQLTEGYENLNNTTNDLSHENQQLKGTINHLQIGLALMNQQIAELDKAMMDKKQLIKDQKDKIEIQENEIRVLKDALKDYNTLKCQFKDLRNELLDLKGSVRVLCRLKPLNGDAFSLKFTDTSLIVGHQGKKLNFTFDRVFDTNASQDEIYKECNLLVNSGVDGYNVCIFVYGQTGSGKTYTMDGIVDRSVRDIFDVCKALEQEGWIFTISSTYVEIYNEEIRDLYTLNKNVRILHEGNVSRLENAEKKHHLKVECILDNIRTAANYRATGHTECNKKSSRSHSVLSIYLELRKNDEFRQSCINFTDLAGSERLNSSKAEGIKLKETQSINKSLAALGNVFNAILREDTHVPFRDSKLTYMLQNSLQGNSRTLMLVNISVEQSCMNESICSLRFANKVSECKLGNAKKMAIKTIMQKR